MLLEGSRVALQPFHRDPPPGESTEVSCLLRATSPATVSLDVRDSYPTGGLPGRMVQRVVVDGLEIWSHELGATGWEGWQQVDLGEVRPDQQRVVRIQIVALQPDPGAAWGWAAATEVHVRGGMNGGREGERRIRHPAR